MVSRRFSRWRRQRRGAVLSFVAIVLSGAAAAESPTFSFGVLPQQPPSHLLQTWGPLLAYLESRTGYRFVFKTAPDLPTFDRRLAAGEYDFAYMNPYQFVLHNERENGYQAVVRTADERVRGVVVVHRDSPLRDLNDLDGKVLAYPAPGSFVASMLPRAHLAALGIRSGVHYVSSHDSVYHVVATGRLLAGGGMFRTLQGLDPVVRNELRVLWVTPSYTSHAIAAHERVSKGWLDVVQATLTGMHLDPQAAPVLENLNLIGFTVAQNADWDDVRALEVDCMRLTDM